jgi:preprotein translocase subunit YajC
MNWRKKMDNMLAILVQVGPILLVFVVFYFFLMLPEKKRKKKYQSMLEELKLNDEVVTRGGIIGKISHIDDKGITIETSTAKTRVKLDKSGISHKVKAD